LRQGVDFVLDSLERMDGGELFVPKIPSYRIMDVIEAVAPGCAVEEIGIRSGEKLHESMITVDDARNTVEYPTHFVIQPTFGWWETSHDSGVPCKEGFAYTSDGNDHWLSIAELRELASLECDLE